MLRVIVMTTDIMSSPTVASITQRNPCGTTSYHKARISSRCTFHEDLALVRVDSCLLFQPLAHASRNDQRIAYC